MTTWCHSVSLSFEFGFEARRGAAWHITYTSSLAGRLTGCRPPSSCAHHSPRHPPPTYLHLPARVCAVVHEEIDFVEMTSPVHSRRLNLSLMETPLDSPRHSLH